MAVQSFSFGSSAKANLTRIRPLPLPTSPQITSGLRALFDWGDIYIYFVFDVCWSLVGDLIMNRFRGRHTTTDKEPGIIDREAVQTVVQEVMEDVKARDGERLTLERAGVSAQVDGMFSIRSRQGSRSYHN